MGGILMPIFGDEAQQGYITPNQIPNLNLWYNASASTTVVNGVSKFNFNTNQAVVNGSSISKWQDLQAVGGDSNVNGGTGNNPTYTIPIQNGLGSVTYNPANSNNLDINPATFIDTKTGLTIYTVARPTSFPGTKFPLVNGNNGAGMYWNGTNWTFGVTQTYYGTTSLTNDTSKFHIYGMVFTGSTSVVARYDKTSPTLSYTGVAPANTGAQGYCYFGGDNRSGGNGGVTASSYMAGYIGEVLIWTRALSAAELTSVETYLNTKWGLGLT